jgi:hypothetical protein
MQAPQLELWSAEPHVTPPVFQQLTPPQREGSDQLSGRTDAQSRPNSSHNFSHHNPTQQQP